MFKGFFRQTLFSMTSHSQSALKLPRGPSLGTVVYAEFLLFPQNRLENDQNFDFLGGGGNLELIELLAGVVEFGPKVR